MPLSCEQSGGLHHGEQVLAQRAPGAVPSGRARRAAAGLGTSAAARCPELENALPHWHQCRMLLITVGLGEFLASRRQHASITEACATAIYFFLDGVQARGGQSSWVGPSSWRRGAEGMGLAWVQHVRVWRGGRQQRLRWARISGQLPNTRSRCRARCTVPPPPPTLPAPSARPPRLCAAGVCVQPAADTSVQGHGGAAAPQLPGTVRGCRFAAAAGALAGRARASTPAPTLLNRCVVCRPPAHRCQPAVPNGATIPLQNITQATLWQNQVGGLLAGSRLGWAAGACTLFTAGRSAPLRLATSVGLAAPRDLILQCLPCSTPAPTRWAWRRRGGWPSHRVRPPEPGAQLHVARHASVWRPCGDWHFHHWVCSGVTVAPPRCHAGHTSLSFVLTVYACGYLIWVWHWRHPLPPKRLSFWQARRGRRLRLWGVGMRIACMQGACAPGRAATEARRAAVPASLPS